jgi:carbon storage regulator CsrA
MLHLMRKKGEAIFIGDDIKIYIRQIKYNSIVELAIYAPDDVPIHREEIRIKILAAEELNRKKGIPIKYKKNKLHREALSICSPSSTLLSLPSTTR